MEFIPEIRNENGRLTVLRSIERKKAHEDEKVWHPTTQILVTDGERFALVDKYPKNARKAELFGYTPPKKLIRLDVFGGHMQYGQLTDADRTDGISRSTFDACAFEETADEMMLDGRLCEPEPGRLRYLGLTEIEDEREVAAVYLYRVEPGQTVTGRDDIALPAGGREQVTLSVYWLTAEELRTMHALQSEGRAVLPGGQSAEICSGLFAAWKLYEERQ